MKRRSVVLAALATGATGVVGVAGVAAPAAAVPPGLEANKEPFALTCDGDEVVAIGGNGRSAWVGDTLFLAVELHAVGTFTPTGGSPQPVEFSMVWGARPGAETIECEADVTETDEGGTLQAHFEVTAMVVPGHDA